MPIDVDTRNALRRPGELVGLIRAILAASSTDESHWLEWKASLDLFSASGRFHVAKAVLGFANRMPDSASSACGGVGYVVVGCEPGNLSGVAEMDPAQLDDGLSPYLGGAKGPNWGAYTLDVDGSRVLVVTVEPPEWGDPIFTLRKGYDSHNAGRVFVRKNGKTAPASADDMDLLQTRLRVPKSDPLDLDVSASGDVPLSWFDPSTIGPSIESWVESRTRLLITEAENIDRRKTEAQDRESRDPFIVTQRLAASLAQAAEFSNPLVEHDKRSLEEYSDEVEKWGERLAASAKDAFHTRYLERGHGILSLRATNSTDQNLTDVLIRVTFPGDEVVGLDEFPHAPRLPKPPRTYGEPVRHDLTASIIPRSISDMPISPIIPQIKDTWVDDGSVRIGWGVGDLRPRETDESDPVYVFLSSRPDDGILRGNWEATSKSTDGVLKGELTVSVAEEPVNIVSILTEI